MEHFSNTARVDWPSCLSSPYRVIARKGNVKGCWPTRQFSSRTQTNGSLFSSKKKKRGWWCLFSRCQCYLEACRAKSTGRRERLHCSLTKKDKQRACIVLATNMNFVFLPKPSLWWEHLVANAFPYLLMIQTNISTLHNDFAETLTSVFFRNSSELGQGIHTVPKRFKFPLSTTSNGKLLLLIADLHLPGGLR